MNNKLFIPMETLYLVPLGLFFLLWIANKKKTFKLCREPSNDHSYKGCFPISLVFLEKKINM